jgi:hypothetical protein
MTTFARIDSETLAITLMYNANGGPKWAPDDLECPIPFDVLADQAVLVDGVITFQADPQKLDAKTAQAWTALRSRRNQLLKDTDWVALADAHLSQDRKDAWFAYRQALRDLPDETQDPTQVEWPLDPTQIPPTPVTGSRLSSLLTHADVELEPVPSVVEEPVPEVPVVPEAEPVQEVTEAEPVQEVTEAEPVQEVTEAEPVPEAEPVQEVTEAVTEVTEPQ